MRRWLIERDENGQPGRMVWCGDYCPETVRKIKNAQRAKSVPVPAQPDLFMEWLTDTSSNAP
jgi:hypothetical protein